MQRKLTDVGQQPLLGDMPAFLRIESIPYNAARYKGLASPLFPVTVQTEDVDPSAIQFSVKEIPPLEWAGFTLMESARPSLWLKLKNFCIFLWRQVWR